METVKHISPIFFPKTRSFLLGILPTGLTTIDLLLQQMQGEHAVPVANGIAAVLSVFGAEWTGEQIAGVMQTLYPLYLLVFMQQRGTFSGAIPRPYTGSPEKERVIKQAIENGVDAFDLGQKIGRSLKR